MPTNAQKVVRYKDDLFNELKILKDISYRPDTENKRFTLDIYMPANDDRKDRPVVVWMHGGGFKFGKKTSRGIPIWCKQFARKGYVCVAINYSLSKEKTLSDPQAFIRGCQRALLDLEAAINFMEAREDEYGIDLRQLILAGNSAGGTMALQAAYGIPNGFLDSISGNELEKKNLPVTAVINYWGAIVDSSWLQTKKIPIYSALGEHDRVVSPTSKSGFLFGGITIHKIADRESIPNALRIYKKMGHEIQRHFIPFFAGPAVRKRWKNLGKETAEFLYRELYSS